MNSKENMDRQYKIFHDHAVHFVISNSYMIFLLALDKGLLFVVVFSFRLFNLPVYRFLGFFMILIGSGFIYWAQVTTGNNQKIKQKNPENYLQMYFNRGPYKYFRNPTHLGLSVMTVGLGIMINSASIVLLVVVAFLVTKFVFLKKEENILEKKYGQVYLDYKKKFKSWL